MRTLRRCAHLTHMTLLLKNRSLEETELDKETSGSEIGVKVSTSQTMNTNECLKEFDDILEEINKDVTKGASLDDIDDVLKDMAEENPKDLMFQMPRFDLADISSAYLNLKGNDIDETNSLVTLDNSKVSLSDDFIANINEVIENDVISISSENSLPEDSVKNISTENTGNIEQYEGVNSINTQETKENIKHSESIECEKLHIKHIGAEKDQGIDEINAYETNAGTQNNSVEICREVNDLTTKDVVFIDDSDDGGYQSTDFEFITEEEAKMDGLIIHFNKNTLKRKSARVNKVKTLEIAVDQISNATKTPRLNKMKRKARNYNKDPDWAPESETDSISDDEFIPGYMEYSSKINTRSKNDNTFSKSPQRNNTVTLLRQIRIPRRYNGSPRFTNLQINPETFTARNISAYNVDMTQNNKERDDPNNFQGFDNKCRNELAEMKMVYHDKHFLIQKETNDLKLSLVDYSEANSNQDLPGTMPDSIINIPATNGMQDGPELNNIAILKSPEKGPDKYKVDSEPGHSQKPEENIIPGTSAEIVPDPKILNPGPSGMQEMPKFDNSGAGPRCKRNRSHVDDIKKWRMYQMRTRLNRPQFVVDYSYRDQHRIYQDHEFHQLFDPNRAPLPSARSMRSLENKSTVCKNSMLVEYQGVGFDVPPPRRDSGSEDDEAKREANECAQKILEIYPEQNIRRSRRRRF